MRDVFRRESGGVRRLANGERWVKRGDRWHMLGGRGYAPVSDAYFKSYAETIKAEADRKANPPPPIF